MASTSFSMSIPEGNDLSFLQNETIRLQVMAFYESSEDERGRQNLKMLLDFFIVPILNNLSQSEVPSLGYSHVFSCKKTCSC